MINILKINPIYYSINREKMKIWRAETLSFKKDLGLYNCRWMLRFVETKKKVYIPLLLPTDLNDEIFTHLMQWLHKARKYFSCHVYYILWFVKQKIKTSSLIARWYKVRQPNWTPYRVRENALNNRIVGENYEKKLF